MHANANADVLGSANVYERANANEIVCARNTSTVCGCTSAKAFIRASTSTNVQTNRSTNASTCAVTSVTIHVASASVAASAKSHVIAHCHVSAVVATAADMSTVNAISCGGQSTNNASTNVFRDSE